MSRKITNALRAELKIPFGEICTGLRKEKFMITVGDETTWKAIESKFFPDLMIYDGKIKRKAVPEIEKKIDKVNVKKIEVRNDPGTISDESWIAIEEGLKERAKIKVTGEEDLLVLPCVLLAKEGSAVYYGQPDDGIVRVAVNKKSRDKASIIIKQMEVI